MNLSHKPVSNFRLAKKEISIILKIVEHFSQAVKSS